MQVQCPGVYEVHLWLDKDEILSGGATHLRQKGLSAIVTVPESGRSRQSSSPTPPP